MIRLLTESQEKKNTAKGVPNVIDTGQARQLIKKERKDTITNEEAASLEVWRFYRRPTKRYQFSFGRPYRYTFSEYGDRLGRIEEGRKGVYIHGDNGFLYYALHSRICFDTMTITATAHSSQWPKIRMMNQQKGKR